MLSSCLDRIACRWHVVGGRGAKLKREKKGTRHASCRSRRSLKLQDDTPAPHPSQALSNMSHAFFNLVSTTIKLDSYHVLKKAPLQSPNAGSYHSDHPFVERSWGPLGMPQCLHRPTGPHFLKPLRNTPSETWAFKSF